MKLFPPDHEIKLYETGFGEDDRFNRLRSSKSLSELVERIEDPLVIALDGGWGSGKTWFLKRWVGAHRLENGGRATTVYFDAFANDFMDDPLIALTGAIGDCLPKKAESRAWGKIKMAAAKLAKPATRVGLAVATGSISEIAGPVIDAVAEAARKEIETAAEIFWAREDGKRAAMQQLRSALLDLANTGAYDGAEPVPLVVVVDELDRCRPDYALALIEVIKHFFAVPNIHFVLGVNLDALRHSVRARYGAGIDAERYLRRFISISMRLPDHANDQDDRPIARAYFKEMARAMGISPDAITTFDEHLEMVAATHNLSLRDINRLLSRLALASPDVFTRWLFGWREVFTSMLLFHVVEPDLERKAVDGTLTHDDVKAFYGINLTMLNEEDHESFRRRASVTSDIWEFVTSGGARPEKDRESLSRIFDRVWARNPQGVPRTIYRKHFGTFAFGDTEK